MELIITVLLLDLFVIALICHSYITSKKHYLQCIESKAHDRLVYIQSLLEMIYTYKHNPPQLQAHLIQQMSIKKILAHHVIDDNCTKYIPKGLDIRKNDKLLYSLLQDGFSYRELCVVFELNNLNSAYVKYHRVHKKINGIEVEVKANQKNGGTKNKWLASVLFRKSCGE